MVLPGKIQAFALFSSVRRLVQVWTQENGEGWEVKLDQGHRWCWVVLYFMWLVIHLAPSPKGAGVI